MPQILPLLNSNGLVLTQFPSSLNGEPALRTVITHVATEKTMEDTAPLMLDKQTAQGLGSAITYMRRYSLLSILGLVADVDDDGEAATKAAPRTTQRKTTPRPAPKPAASGGDDEW